MSNDFRLPDISAMHREMAESIGRKNNPAGYMRDRLVKLISDFERRLGPNDELGAQVIGGGAAPFHLRAVSHSDPDILVFSGIDLDGNRVQLLQHHTQMSVMLVALHKLEEKPFRMGF